jgi:DNA-binding GntR family transcriptional regulator
LTIVAAARRPVCGAIRKKEVDMSLTREAFERIRDAIVSGALEFGEHLSETQIANALGISKAPVRAAFMELRDKGLVNIVPQSGTYVFSPTPEDVRKLSHFRALLEEEAVHQAMELQPGPLFVKLDEAIARMKRAVATKNWDIYRKADSSFHLALLEESGNRYMLNAYHLGAAALEALRVRLQRGQNNFRQQSFNEHIDMAKLLRAGKIDDACAILRRHILIINDSLHTFPLNPQKGSRKGLSSNRDYAEVFSRSNRRDGQPASDKADRADPGRRSGLARSEREGRRSARPDRGAA